MSYRFLQPLTYEIFCVSYLSCETCRGNVNATPRASYIMSGAFSLHEPTIEVCSPQPHAALVVVGGEHDLNSADELRQTFDQSLAHCDHLIVDLSATEFIDASTIGVLMDARRHAIELDRTLCVVLGTERFVERILEVSGVLPLLNVVPTVERAFDALASSASPSDLATHAN